MKIPLQKILSLLFLFIAFIQGTLAAEEACQESGKQTSEEKGKEEKKTFEDREEKECKCPEDFEWKICDATLQIGGLVQVDGRFFLRAENGKSTFLIRRARLYATGVLHEIWGYMLMARWDKMQPNIHYAWIETVKPEDFRIRVGLFKEPFSLEALYSDVYWDFNERSLGVANYLQIEDIGVMAFGKICKDRFEYGLGIFNGRGRQFDNNHSKEAVARLVMAPIGYGYFRKLYFGVSGSSGKYTTNLSGEAFKTGAGTEFWVWGNGVSVNARRNRWGLDVEWLYGPMAIRAEYLHVDWGHVDKRYPHRRQYRPFTGYGWYYETSFILTGEEKPRNKPVTPKYNFDYTKCTWGAWEVVARYEAFNAPHRLIKAHFAEGANHVEGFTVGINCYMNRHMAFKLQWQRLNFNRLIKIDGHKLDHESVIIARLQAEF